MPHITVEYSANLEERLGIDALIGALHDAAIATGLFEIGGIRTRGSRRDHYRIADANPLNGFVAITVRGAKPVAISLMRSGGRRGRGGVAHRADPERRALRRGSPRRRCRALCRSC